MWLNFFLQIIRIKRKKKREGESEENLYVYYILIQRRSQRNVVTRKRYFNLIRIDLLNKEKGTASISRVNAIS